MGWDAGCLGLQWAAWLEELRKGISGRKLPLRIQEPTKRSVKQLSRFQSSIQRIFPDFILFPFFPREYEIRTVYAAHSAGRYRIFPSHFRLLQSQLLLLLRCCSPNAISRPSLYLVSISLCIDRMGL